MKGRALSFATSKRASPVRWTSRVPSAGNCLGYSRRELALSVTCVPSSKMCIRDSIYTDLDKFEKIIFNLLSNAFKYTPRGKSISLIIELQADVVLVQVKDEGKGIDYHKLGKLFDRFETLGSTQSSLSTGIGLSLVKDLVELMHGKINVNTTLGEGSTFIVSLPLSVDVYRNDSNAEFVLDDGKCSLPATETIATEEVEQKSFTVLVVEDNDELRHFICLLYTSRCV